MRSVTKLRGYRQDIIDERAGVAVAGVMVEEAGAPIMLVVRAKVDAEQKISELELVTTRSRADGMIFTIDTYSGAASKPMNLVPKPSQLADAREGDRDRHALPDAASATRRPSTRSARRSRRTPIASRTAR